ncbi:DoxX family membrane protein [Actinokineospora auranticolor]|uniref:DoxX-like protein n=1 Tax=Actinokineospora auranticolor TaxID=155976 RepID=A0A2S6GPG9_9PSEU|nr:DoxX family membrane protein [Actinokineospora auranticolor]PPK67070.1 DoxX-like protein [Actinokineospora auranticolor]
MGLRELSTRAAGGGGVAGVLDNAERVLGRVAIPALRFSLGLVYVWFGLLKVIGQSPVADLVEASVPWVRGPWLVAGLGWVEIVLGVALVLGRPRRLAPAAAAVHLIGTFLVFFEAPGMALRDGNVLLLSATGEFVLKNLVLVSAAFVLIGLGGRRPAPENPL